LGNIEKLPVHQQLQLDFRRISLREILHG
jgi:hypothetical protein